MNIFVTGSSGFIGASLAEGLATLGHKVTAIARPPSPKALTNPVQSVLVPITKHALGPLLSKHRPEVLIHCVGTSTVHQAQSNPSQDFNSTVGTVSEALEAVRTFSPDTLFILVSSASVYGDSGDARLCETLPPQPISVYGYNKWMAELLVQQYTTQFGLNTLIVRPFSVYGETLRKQVVFDLCKKLILRPTELLLSGTGEESRDFLHIDDLVSALVHLVNLRHTGVINLATGTPTTIANLAGFIASRLAPKTRITFTGELSQGNPLSLVGSVSMASQLGIRQSVPLETGLLRVCASVEAELRGRE